MIDPKLLAAPTPAPLQSGTSTSSPTVTVNPTAPPARLILPAPKPCFNPPQSSPVLFPFIICNPTPTSLASPANVYQSSSTPSNPSTMSSKPSKSPNSNLSNPTLNTTPNSASPVFPILNYGSQRRTAEQRAAFLRADRLIAAVEPHRVFCSVCRKWVQLRRDSAYCSYPWMQHRRKCLARALVFALS